MLTNWNLNKKKNLEKEKRERNAVYMSLLLSLSPSGCIADTMNSLRPVRNNNNMSSTWTMLDVPVNTLYTLLH